WPRRSTATSPTSARSPRKPARPRARTWKPAGNSTPWPTVCRGWCRSSSFDWGGCSIWHGGQRSALTALRGHLLQVIPRGLGQLLQQGTQAQAPLLTHVLEVGIALFHPGPGRHLQAVAAVHQHVQRQAHGQVAADGRVEGNQCAAQGMLQAGAVLQRTVEDRLAVLALADLEIGRVLGGSDEVALRIQVEQ